MRQTWFVAAISFLLGAQNLSAMELIESWPEQGATLDRPLRSVHLWFDSTPDTAVTDVSIIGASSDLTIRGLHSMGDNDLMAMVSVDMPDGNYVLSWRAGEEQGKFSFSVQRPRDQIDDQWELPLDIGVVLYPGAEPLDVFGPLEMWMNAGPDNIRIHLIAQEAGPVALTTTAYPPSLAPKVEANHSFDSYPELDVLMVPGGVGTLVEADNPAMLAFLRRVTGEVTVTTSVCTGSGLLAKAGVLDGVAATGNKAFFDYLVSLGEADWKPEARWVESGRFFTSSGVTAGIDMSLAVIARFFGADIARMIAVSTEYVWNEDAGVDPFTGNLNSATPYVDRLRKSFEDQTRGLH